MKSKLKRICALLMSFVLLAILLPVGVSASGRLAPGQTVDLIISYRDGQTPIPNARFSIYKVADTDEYAHMTLTAEFEAYRDIVSGLTDLDHLTQEQWRVLASTLRGYVLNDRCTAVHVGRTDADGTLSVPGLEAGLYLVSGTRATTPDFYTYCAVPALLFLPGEDDGEAGWSYEVTCEPKFTKEYNPPDDPDDDVITRKVLKIWEDTGYQTLRPAEVTVQLLRNGSVFDTQVLDQHNSWRYAWDNLDADAEWDVIEQPVENYTVSITRSGITYTVINQYAPPSEGTNLPIQKRVTGDQPGTDSEFKFVFAAKDDTCPMPAESSGTEKELTITGAGSCMVGAIDFDAPGTYEYTVRETDGGVEGYTYDTEVHTVRCEVAEQDDTLSVGITITNSKGETVPVIEFTNSYKLPGGRLPQTGILWWPVPVLLCAGLILIMIGAVRRRRCS